MKVQQIMFDEKEELKRVETGVKISRLEREKKIECFKNKLEELSQEIKKIKKHHDPHSNFYYKMEFFINSLNKSKDMIESAVDDVNDIAKLNDYLKNIKY
jgi:DNA anti-recombination protein RmuC